MSGSGTSLSANDRIAGVLGKVEGSSAASVTLVGGYFTVEGSHSGATTYGIYTPNNLYVGTNVQVNDYLVALGGIHVGGTSDPGTDNLVVDGDVSVGGHVTGGGDRAYFDGGEQSPFRIFISNISNKKTNSCVIFKLFCHFPLFHFIS